MHWRGGDTHDAANVSPRTMRDFGEDVDGLVVAPRGRGTSSWYVGRRRSTSSRCGTTRCDLRDRRGPRLRDRPLHGRLGVLPAADPLPGPLRASLPYAGVPTQGLWVGCEFDPCFQGTNGGNAKDQWTNPLLDNLRNVPIAISHGVETSWCRSPARSARPRS
jgi:hypothetical protein